MHVPLSPFRYPGGKHALAEYLASVLKENLLVGSPFFETHAGGASISLHLLEQGLISRATLIEYDPLVYSFWKSVKENPSGLCNRVRRFALNLKSWHRFQKYLAADALERYSTLELGAAGLFMNRTNFSGIIHAGPIGGFGQKSAYKLDCRFNRNRIVGLIEKISTYANRISVVRSDAVKYLRENGERIERLGGVVYSDPPYYVQGERLYRFHYKLEQHKGLANMLLQQRFRWIVSYDNHPDIFKMFKGQKIIPISFNYTVKQSRKVEELLISNTKLLKPLYSEVSLVRQKRAA